LHEDTCFSYFKQEAGSFGSVSFGVVITPRIGVTLEKLTLSQAVKILPVVHGTEVPQYTQQPSTEPYPDFLSQLNLFQILFLK
jgi:hypothetical protein